MGIRGALIGRNVQILDGHRFLGALSLDDRGLHFQPRLLAPARSWHIAWEDVTDIEVGRDVTQRWSNFLPVKVAHAATHITVHTASGDLQGFVVPDVTVERVHNLLRPSIPRWNHGTGARQA